ncbi:Adenine-specific DNA methylase, contains a Zn-ribbon domain [Carboxydocella sporoproducens DSM 16521]|uniref:Adenine-specific DNA methylase, contains a Zn-ribbon domain n=2 Tax=Carboxydocella TaxID=178898 RepID=A0A1T4MI25_9FIRM|nr:MULTISPECIES: DUF1156 domain-containing protein [Carboxydocella]AVX21335.1 Adenine-specific DNA methylase, contains a Zn-ribbon domain [Carboxydocella thermautotrophica]SJZ66496.1 Adenine-specific DNA methylase, contains a Zn-ribbon domain [Carboxydocella sporoproducens DSM 16521]
MEKRFIEAGFPCHQVGAETQRERDTGKAPPTNRLHVWWARRPLTPSRAAILGSLLPATTDPEWFLRQLGIEKVQAMVNGEPWTLVGNILKYIEMDDQGKEWLIINRSVLNALQKEQERRKKNRDTIDLICKSDPGYKNNLVILGWLKDSEPLPEPFPGIGERIEVRRIAANPAMVNERIELKDELKKIVKDFNWTDEDLYGYKRAFMSSPLIRSEMSNYCILDPTAGGGSIPFEALRLGCKVIANDLNPVANVILNATLNYPLRFGINLSQDINFWAQKLISSSEKKITRFFPENSFSTGIGEREYIVDYLYTRQVTCPHCGGEAPLLNTCWLSKEGEQWGVRLITDHGKVSFETYRVRNGKGPNGEDPNFATVKDGVGTCIHCRQAISAEEIKAQARGESPHGKWQDRLYCIVAVRYQPELDANGQPVRYRSGEKAGQIKTKKVRFFRPPNEQDLAALVAAEKYLQQRWPEWEGQGLIPTEKIPDGHKTKEPLRAGMQRWCNLFTPRQLLGHLTLVEELNRLKPEILKELGEERGRAVITYLQFVIDKGLDYNSKQTRWEYTRGIVKGTFGRHDFSLKWTFGEMILTGPHSGAAWALSQVLDAYQGIAELLAPLHEKLKGSEPPVTITNGTAAHLNIDSASIDLICIDPPYYNNVQYAELSDYFYVWQRRTLQDLYPDIFTRRLTNKTDEAVANPARDGSDKEAARVYERMMGEIFAECRRVLKDDGLMTIMFTHKTQEAWEALTRSLIENGWIITSSFPVESEAEESTHQKDMAAAASSIFLTCRKQSKANTEPSIWTGFGNTGVAQKIRTAVQEALQEFEPLKLNAVDEMVACYGRALQVLSEHWPVMDGDQYVSPIQAMNEASAVVAHHQIARLTRGKLRPDDLNPEAAMTLTLFGIFGLREFPYDEALNLSRSLNISLETRPAGYKITGRMIGINNENRSRRSQRGQEEAGYFAPLVRKGSKLRLVLPEERNPYRIDNPQTEWDVLHGVILAYREGDIPLVRTYLTQHAEGREEIIKDLLAIWANGVHVAEIRKEAEMILFGLK